jgi:hypothetical protein
MFLFLVASNALADNASNAQRLKTYVLLNPDRVDVCAADGAICKMIEVGDRSYAVRIDPDKNAMWIMSGMKNSRVLGVHYTDYLVDGTANRLSDDEYPVWVHDNMLQSAYEVVLQIIVASLPPE